MANSKFDPAETAGSAGYLKGVRLDLTLSVSKVSNQIGPRKEKSQAYVLRKRD